MSHLLVVLLLLVRIQAQPAPPEKASIEGVVLKSTSAEPLARAQVKLIKVRSEKEIEEEQGAIYFEGGPEANAPFVLSGADGKFLLRDIEPGQYRVSVARNGYAQQWYGKKLDVGQGTILDLQPGRPVKDLEFRLVQGGVVTGRIRDSVGEPLPSLEVALLKVGYGETGKKVLRQGRSVTTDDRGEYRFFWIEPGRYYVRAAQRQEGYFGAAVVDRFVPTVYYPGFVTPENATIIEVLPGSESSAIDIVVPQLSGHTVRGRVVDASTGKPPKAVSIQVGPRTTSGLALEWEPSGRGGARYNATTGTFEIRDVLPGVYWLNASVNVDFNAPISAERLADVKTGDDLWRTAFSNAVSARVPLEMRASDIDDVVVTLTKGVTIPVRVSVEGVEMSALKDFDSIRVNLSNAEESVWGEGTRTNAEGLSRIEGVAPGEYKVNVDTGKVKELYVKDIRYGRGGGLDELVEISDQSASTLQVLLSPRSGQIEGNLVDTLSQPVSGGLVVLIPDDRDRRRLYKQVNADHNGHFVFKAVPPGGYKVFSWEALEYNAFHDSEVLSKYETQGRPVRMQESSKETVDLKVIPTPKQ